MGNSSLLNGIFGNQLWNNEFDVWLFTSYFLMVSSNLIISNRVLTRSTNPPLKSSFHDPLSGSLCSLSASTAIHPPYCPSPLLPSLSHIYQSISGLSALLKNQVQFCSSPFLPPFFRCSSIIHWTIKNNIQGFPFHLLDIAWAEEEKKKQVRN